MGDVGLGWWCAGHRNALVFTCCCYTSWWIVLNSYPIIGIVDWRDVGVGRLDQMLNFFKEKQLIEVLLMKEGAECWRKFACCIRCWNVNLAAAVGVLIISRGFLKFFIWFIEDWGTASALWENNKRKSMCSYIQKNGIRKNIECCRYDSWRLLFWDSENEQF